MANTVVVGGSLGLNAALPLRKAQCRGQYYSPFSSPNSSVRRTVVNEVQLYQYLRKFVLHNVATQNGFVLSFNAEDSPRAYNMLSKNPAAELCISPW